MCAKQAKVPQTEWTRQGKSIADTSVPLYNQGLTRLGQYTEDPSKYIDQYLNKYYNADTASNQDFLRAYNRAMGNATGNNYAATAGGLASSAQRAYNDQQRYYNDLAARLREAGVSQSRNMYDQDVVNQMNALNQYNAGYQLGQNYSKIDQMNQLIDKQNKNWWSGAMSSAGQGLSMIPMPWTQAIGAGLQLAGGATAVDTSQAMNAITGGSGGSAASQGSGLFGDALGNIAKMDWSPTADWWKNSKGKSFKDKAKGFFGIGGGSTKAPVPSIRG